MQETRRGEGSVEREGCRERWTGVLETSAIWYRSKSLTEDEDYTRIYLLSLSLKQKESQLQSTITG